MLYRVLFEWDIKLGNINVSQTAIIECIVQRCGISTSSPILAYSCHAHVKTEEQDDGD